MAGSSARVPSGRTARSGAYRATIAPPYTIKLPSGDHTGLNAGPATRRTGVPPCAGILNSPPPLGSLPPVTIHLLSGDQEAAPRHSGSVFHFASAPRSPGDDRGRPP